MDLSTDLVMKEEGNNLIYSGEESTGRNNYPVAVCGPAPFVSSVETSLKNSFLPVKTIPFTKSDRETAESIAALRPETVLLDSAFASEGVMWLFQKRGINVIKMDSGWKKTEEFRNEKAPAQRQEKRAQFINFLFAYSAVCLIWEI